MLASQYPEYIARLVIIEAYPVDPPSEDRSGPPPPLPIESYATIDDAFAETYRRQPYADKASLRHEVEHGLSLQDDGRWTWRMDPALHTAAWRGEIRPGPALEWPALALIRSPAILIYGVHSIPLERATMVAQTIPNCQLVAIPHAAHDLPNENPVSFISALRAFLTETPDATERPREGTVSGSDLEL